MSCLSRLSGPNRSGRRALRPDRASSLVPVGLGARDTLRLEAGYLLYGNDIDAWTTPLEAGLQRLVHFETGSLYGVWGHAQAAG